MFGTSCQRALLLRCLSKGCKNVILFDDSRDEHPLKLLPSSASTVPAMFKLVYKYPTEPTYPIGKTFAWVLFNSPYFDLRMNLPFGLSGTVPTHTGTPRVHPGTTTTYTGLDLAYPLA